MFTGLLAGVIVGFVIGFFGAGSAVVGLPIILMFSNLDGHLALGTNVLGISMIALFIFLYRTYKGDILFREAATFTIPGVIGNYSGIQMGLLFPGHKLLFLLGFILFLIAGWMYYSSSKNVKSSTASNNQIINKDQTKDSRRIILIVFSALIIGAAAGFFAISGGFMIVPALILAGKLDITEAAGTAIIPIVVFTGLAGIEYWFAGSVEFNIAYAMVLPGILFGIFGIWLSKRLPKPIMQKMFAGFLVLIGVYMIFR